MRRRSTGAAEPAPIKKPQDSDGVPQGSAVLVRVTAGMSMFVVFCGVMYAGHMYVWMMVMALQVLSFRELVRVRYFDYKSQMDMEMPLFRTLQWCWFLVALLFVYGEFVAGFARRHQSATWLVPYTRYHSLATLSAYCGVFAASVGTLRKRSVKYQVGQLSWTIVTLCIVVGQMKFVAHNIFNGLFWFVFPAWLVMNNECWAYVWGTLLGRTLIRQPFLRLSPKKTWEGFLGAAVSTVVTAYFSAPLLATQWATCPMTSLTFKVSPSLECDLREVFLARETIVVPLLGLELHDVLPIQVHAVFFALFASFVAPYGGFLASAIKRAYEVKDFDSIIPGHGGVTDRVDCQFIMALFVYVWYRTLIGSRYSSDWTTILALSKLLTPEHRLALTAALRASFLEDRAA